MTNECSNSENLFPADNQHEVVEKLEIGFKRLNNKFINLLEENQRIKQHNNNLQEENQEILYINSELNEKYQEILRTNSELNEKNQEISRTNLELNKKNQEILRNNSNLIKENENVLRINNDLKEKLQKIDEQFEKLQQDLNLEKQKNKEIQRLEIVSQNLEKNLKILEVDEIDINTINAFKENNEQENCNIDNSPTTFALNDSKSLEKDIVKHIKIVVGLDFGTNYSGFSYCHVANKQNIISNYVWPGFGVAGVYKTNTVLQYDNEYNNVLCWGAEALRVRPKRKNRKQNSQPVELFKLHLGYLPDNLKPKLPINYKKAITDYLREIGKWHGIKYSKNVLLVLTIPAEYSEIEKAIMRECVFEAALIKNMDSEKLQFTTESEAAALYYIQVIFHSYLLEAFMFVDCGEYTTDLTTHKLVRNDPLYIDKATVHIRDFCGSRLINEEFIKFLCERLGTCAIDLLKENNYSHLQYMIQVFRERIMEPFTGDNMEFQNVLDIDEVSPNLPQYVSEETREIMKENEWLIDIKYNDIKKMFDPVVDRIIRLIYIQLSNNKENCSTIFLTGNFCENKYLQNRIKEEFSHHVNNISVPDYPEAAVARGGVIYGLSIISTILDDVEFDILKPAISPRVLKYTYGIKYNWKGSEDPTHGGKNCRFKTLVKRGTEITFDQTFSFNFKPESKTSESFAIYYTQKYNIEYCDEPGMTLLGKLNIDLPDVHLDNRRIDFGLTFGQYEIIASTRNENRQKHEITFCYPNDDF
ncbi:10066_t:CDS:2 [Rhizophagus irregularis]|nr:10066_t:CDS:2 [Rhizophagus irregularis]